MTAMRFFLDLLNWLNRQKLNRFLTLLKIEHQWHKRNVNVQNIRKKFAVGH